MVLSIKVKNKVFPESDIKEIVKDSFERELEVAKFKLDRYSRICNSFENKYKMTSDDFISQFEGGKLNEDDDFFDWYAAKQGVEIWNKKYHILWVFLYDLQRLY